METFEVIEHSINSNLEKGQKEIIGIEYIKPTYIKGIISSEIKKGDKINVENDKIYKNGKEIGHVIINKSSSDVVLDTSHNIKYTGGYSIDGKTIYLDEHFPKILKVEGKDIDTTATIGLHHELPEKWLSDNDFEYPYAHEVATGIEKKYVEYLGVTWKGYCEQVDKYLRKVYSQKLRESPASLDLAPYLYCRDREALKEIRESEPEK